jgi:hypothetical protein
MMGIDFEWVLTPGHDWHMTGARDSDAKKTDRHVDTPEAPSARSPARMMLLWLCDPKSIIIHYL